ncbi:MAG: hypothetical protein R2788_23800 [Saprospiraceae bacterium]
MIKKLISVIVVKRKVDRERNTVIKSANFDKKRNPYNFLETEQGKDDHGENEDMSCIGHICTYDLEPVSGRLLPKE